MLKNAENWLVDIQQGRGNFLDVFLFMGLLVAVTYFWMRVVTRLVD